MWWYVLLFCSPSRTDRITALVTEVKNLSVAVGPWSCSPIHNRVSPLIPVCWNHCWTFNMYTWNEVAILPGILIGFLCTGIKLKSIWYQTESKMLTFDFWQVVNITNHSIAPLPRGTLKLFSFWEVQMLILLIKSKTKICKSLFKGFLPLRNYPKKFA